MSDHQTTANKPSDPILCKMGCGFFVSNIMLSTRVLRNLPQPKIVEFRRRDVSREIVDRCKSFATMMIPVVSTCIAVYKS